MLNHGVRCPETHQQWRKHRDGAHHSYYPVILGRKKALCRYWYCFGVGSRPYTVRDAMFVDKFVVLVGRPVLLALAVERDFGPLELAVGVAERTGAVLFRFCRFDALCISNGASVLDLALNFLLVSLAPGFRRSPVEVVLDPLVVNGNDIAQRTSV